MKSRIVLAVVVACVAASTGCTTALKEGVGVIRGPKGIAAPVQPVQRDLGGYTTFQIGAIEDPYNQLPAGFMDQVRVDFQNQISDSKLPSGSGKRLMLRGVVLYYESSDTLGMAFGPLEEVIVRTEMVDVDSGTVLGAANCIGRTTERVNLGASKKAEGLAKAFVDWILKNHPAGNK